MKSDVFSGAESKSDILSGTGRHSEQGGVDISGAGRQRDILSGARRRVMSL